MAMNRIVDHLVQLPQLPEDIHDSPKGTAEEIPLGSMLFNINIFKRDSAADDEGAAGPLDAVNEKWQCQPLWAGTNASSQLCGPRWGETRPCPLWQAGRAVALWWLGLYQPHALTAVSWHGLKLPFSRLRGAGGVCLTQADKAQTPFLMQRCFLAYPRPLWMIPMQPQ